MKDRQVDSGIVPALTGRLRIIAFIISLIVLSGCQPGQEDHSAHQRPEDGRIDDNSMAGMNHARKADPMESSPEMPHRAKMKSDSDENYWNALATNRTVIARQKLVVPVLAEMDFMLSGNGYIAADARRNHKIPVRMGGRIERLFVKYNNQYVRKGEKLLELYSPELNTYIEEYLYIKRQTTDSVLQVRARQKLLLLGISPRQLKQIGQKGSTPMSIPVYSPFGGYVFFDPSAASAMGTAGGSDAMSVGMNPANNQQSSVPGTELPDNSIREGMYVSKDQTLFMINDFKVLLGLVAVEKEHEKYLRKGQRVTIYSELQPDKPLETTIQWIEPVYRGGQKFSQARVYLSNGAGRLKENSLITASFSVSLRSLFIPASSVYDLGRVSIVWLQVGQSKAGSSIFQARVISTGLRSKDHIEVLSGLKAADQIALDAGYLADSESFIQPQN